MKIITKLNKETTETFKHIINIDTFEYTEEEECGDFLFYNKEYEQNLNFSNYKNVICFDEWFDKIFKEFLKDKYIVLQDYYYLKYSMQNAIAPDVNSIIVGSSYGKVGIDEKSFKEKTVNLSLLSQDFYYATKIAKQVISQNSHIKKVYLASGYYSFHVDMSLCKYDGIPRVAQVYNRLFNDKHNCENLPNIICNEIKTFDFINVKNLEEVISKYVFKQINNDYLAFRNNNNKLSNHSEEEKIKIGKERAELHNNLIKYRNTYEENINIINDFNNFCLSKGVIFVLLVFPFTNYYKNYLLPDFEQEYLSALTRMDQEICYLDLNKIDIYNNEDFEDTDHLGISGAIKTSLILNKLF